MNPAKAEIALERLLEGNERFVVGRPERPNQTVSHLKSVSGAQAPFAVILGCSDSRAPAEIVFDQGIGDLFVIRTAGHRIDDIAVASIEFAVRELGVRLIMVLGHDDCGAIKAAIESPQTVFPWEQTGVQGIDHVPLLLAKLQDVIERARRMPGDPVDNAIDENVRTVMGRLQAMSSVLQEALLVNGLKIVGARYDLQSGRVKLIS